MKIFYGALARHKDAVTSIIEEPRHYLYQEYHENPPSETEEVWFAETPEEPKVDERKQVWIIGAGGNGRELYWLAKSVPGHDLDWVIAGFLNDIPDAMDAYPEYPPIQGTTDYNPRPNDQFVCSIGDVEGRRSVCQKFVDKGAIFLNLIHTGVLPPTSCKMGQGIVVERNATLATDVSVGDFTYLHGNSAISHDVQIGSYCNINPFAIVLGRCKVGSGVVIGSHAVILPDVEIGDNAVIGAGSVVVRSVKAGETVFGVPARTIKIA